MRERYWKEREGDEFFDDYIDVTDEIAALQAERDEVLTRMREMDEVIGRRNQAVLRLETELGEERSLRMNTERDRDGYREGSRRLEAERDRYRTALERIAEQDEPLGWEAQDALKGGSDE